MGPDSHLEGITPLKVVPIRMVGPEGKYITARQREVFVPWQIRPHVNHAEWLSHPEWQEEERQEIAHLRRHRYLYHHD